MVVRGVGIPLTLLAAAATGVAAGVLALQTPDAARTDDCAAGLRGVAVGALGISGLHVVHVVWLAAVNR
jgi:hypothetical protein